MTGVDDEYAAGYRILGPVVKKAFRDKKICRL